MRTTTIMPWTADWAQQYALEEQLIRSVLSPEIVSIYHIGSTAIPTIGYAKPIIDILVVVKQLDHIDAYVAPLQTINYVSKGENGIEGRTYFTKGGDDRSHHLHIYEAGHLNIAKHLNFKEYVLQHPHAAYEYGQLKLKLAHLLPQEPAAYAAGKADFCAVLMDKAMNWAEGINHN